MGPHAVTTALAISTCLGCTPAAATGGASSHHGGAAPAPPVSGIVTRDGSPAPGATITFTALASGQQVAVAVAGRDGRFRVPLAAGDYSIAATAEHGMAWIPDRRITGLDIAIELSGGCHAVTGRVNAAGVPDVDAMFSRHSSNSGDTFVAKVRGDGRFSLCLPAGEYTALLSGAVLSAGSGVSVPSTGDIQLHGHLTREIKRAPGFTSVIPHGIDDLIADIQRSRARLIGLGEATHGSAEFVTERARLTFELAKRARLQLILLEVEAIAALTLDRYVDGEDVDLARAVAGLKFWTADTYEFLHFLEGVREYNAAHADARIRIWGVDAQETQGPAALLVDHAQQLGLSADDRALLELVADARAKAVRPLTAARRAELDRLLSRLSAPGGSTDLDTQLAVAARSLAIQVGYLDGDFDAMYDARRNAGMAELANFIVRRTGAQRACLWAHNDHVSRFSPSDPTMGGRLSELLSTDYYPVGFFFGEGSSRAWDPAHEIGVISHALKPPPPYSLEGALLAATGAQRIAWLALAALPREVRTWLETPRYVRELGAVYNGDDRAMILLDLRSAFDGLVIIPTVHDTSPTPTGVRRAKH